MDRELSVKFGGKNNMIINEKGINIIKRFEGFRSEAYICPAGYKTIGYGHKILPGENYVKICELEAEEILRKDLELAKCGVIRNISRNLSENQFSALCSFVYNLGSAALQRSTLRQKINYGSDEEEICIEFAKWVYSGGRKLPGLIARREVEGLLFCS
ncbi:MAG: lysozyme [Rickettsiaceae bacterium]|nr:lysozyme [Rickettsiaceae bacterium]